MPTSYGGTNSSDNGLVAQAGAHAEGHRFGNKGRFSDVFKAFLHWERKRLPTPGAMNYALESLGLPEYNVIGAGVGPRAYLMKTQPQQQYVPINAVLTNGLGGVVAGQIALQGLYDPNTGTFAGSPIGGGNG